MSKIQHSRVGMEGQNNYSFKVSKVFKNRSIGQIFVQFGEVLPALLGGNTKAPSDQLSIRVVIAISRENHDSKMSLMIVTILKRKDNQTIFFEKSTRNWEFDIRSTMPLSE
jgi:ribosomal 50S subunit-recycling heat shock protein